MSRAHRTIHLNRAIALALIATTIILLAAGAAAALGAGEGTGLLQIKQTDTIGFPKVEAIVSLGTDKAPSSWTVTENGKSVKDLKVAASPVNHQPVAVTMVIDVSGSMKGEPLARAKEAAAVFVRRARANDQISLIAFNHTVKRVLGFTSNKAEVLNAINRLQASGDTAVYDATAAGLNGLAAHKFAAGGGGQGPTATAASRKSVVLLSDGLDESSKATAQSVTALAGKLRIPVYAIALKSGSYDPRAVASIASASGGRLLVAPSPGSLAALYDSVAAELHNEYRLTYTSPATKGNADIVVTTRVANQTAVARTTVSGLPVAPAKPKPAKTQAPKPEPSPSTPALDPAVTQALPWIAALMAFATAVLFAIFFLITLGSRKNTLNEQLKFYDLLRAEAAGLPAEKKQTMLTKAQDTLVGAVGRASTRHGFSSFAELRLIQAGLPVRPHEFILLHIVISIGSALLVLLATHSRLITVLALALAVITPLLIVQVLIQRRREAFDEQFPDVLAMLAGFLRAGYGVQQAIATTAQEVKEPAGPELRLVTRNVELGIPMEEAVHRMHERIGTAAMGWLVVAIAINRETGGNLAEILESMGNSLRARHTQQRQVKALTSEGKLSAAILIILPFVQAALLFWLNGEYMMILVSSGPGLLMLALGGTLMLAGALWINKIVKIDY